MITSLRAGIVLVLSDVEVIMPLLAAIMMWLSFKKGLPSIPLQMIVKVASIILEKRWVGFVVH